MSSNNDPATALAQQNGKAVSGGRTAPDLIAEIDRQLDSMPPDEYARNRSLKRRRTMLASKEGERRAQRNGERARVLNWIAANKEKFPELALAIRHIATAPGEPYLILPVARGSYHGLCLYVMSYREHASQAQREWMVNVMDQGYCAREAQTAGWAIHYLTWYLEGAKEPDL